MRNRFFSGTKRRIWLAISLLVLVSSAIINAFVDHFDWPVWILALTVIVLGGMLINLSFKPIARTLDRLSLHLDAVAGGKYGQEIRPIPADDTQKAILAFNKMSAAVDEVIAAATADRDRFSIILTNMADGIFVVNAASRITLINPAAQKIFKLDTEVVGRPFIEATRDAEVHRIMRLCLENGRQESGFVENRARHMYLGVVATPMQKSKGCILLVQDLTELKRLETVRRDFVANISHELRTPMASLKALAETLNEGAVEDPEVARQFLERIDVEVDKLIQMTQELAELSNIESNATRLIKSPTDIKVLLRSAST